MSGGLSLPVAGINSISSEATVGSPPATSTPTLRCGPVTRIAPSVPRPENLFAGSFPTPKRFISSQQAAIEALVKDLDEGTETLCPGEYGREALEIGIAIRESHLRGGEKLELPLADRSLSKWVVHVAVRRSPERFEGGD